MPGAAGLREPFLSALDSRAAVKGSRDALGAGRIWIPLARRVVGNVNTVARSVRDYTTTMLGYLLADQVIARDPSASRLDVFLKTEQLIAYVRVAINGDVALRGTERVQANLAARSRITLSTHPRHQILASQRIYGLWGYYTGATRSSGLLTGEPPIPSEAAIQALERILPGISTGAATRDGLRGQLLGLMRRESPVVDLKGTFAPAAHLLGRAFQPRIRSSEVPLYTHHLLHGGDADSTDGRQRQLVDLLRDTLPIKDFSFSPAAVGQLALRSKRLGPSHADLTDALLCIERAAANLALTQSIFRNLLAQDGVSIDRHADILGRHCGASFTAVKPQEFIDLLGHPFIDLTQPEIARWTGILQAMASSDSGGIIRAMVQANAAVMAERGGAPWITIERGVLRVAMRDDHAALAPVQELVQSWPFTFFLDSLRGVALQLEHPTRG